MKRKAVFVTDRPEETVRLVYLEDTIKKLTDELDFPAGVLNIGSNNIEQYKDFTNECSYIFTTWGMLNLSESDIEKYFKKCEVVFYGAGSVQYFAKEYLNRGIRVSSAWVANGIPVAEYVVSQILLSCKGYFKSVTSNRIKKRSDWGDASKVINTNYSGNYNTKIGILGIGTIGKRIITMLKALNIKTEILVYDPYFKDEQAQSFGVRKSSLEEIFKTCDVVSNHIANLPSTEKMINKSHFNLMKDYATFINTGRGQQIIETDLTEVLKNNQTLTALIDVTDPEPPDEESENCELYKLENVILTPHIAGVINKETGRLGDYMYEEYKLYESEKKLNYEVTLEMLKYMA